MKNDTKVGVLVGLVIVVVASGYFYGSSRNAEDIFISTDANATAIPQIPLSTDRKVALATSSNREDAPSAQNRVLGLENVGRLSTRGSRSPGRSSDRTAAKAPDTRLPEGFVVPEGRTTGDFRMPEDRLPPARHDFASESNQAIAVRTDPNPGERPDRPIERATPAVTNHVALRSGAADALTKATRENLRNAHRPTPDLPTPAQPPTESWPQQHEVQDGETLYEIAILYYGSGLDVERIRRANPNIKNPKRIRPGQSIILPDPNIDPAGIKPGPRTTAPRNTAAPRTYEVREGDSFYTIAKHLYGDGRRWNAIYKLNKALVKNNPKRLREGMTIKLPPAE